jgi:Uncharacterized ABC-type transport system, ATPase component
MRKKHSSIIKFDLHIHSFASAYKEKNKIVENSTKENIPILLSKLDEHNVSLFSITDHNRFDLELYQEIITILSQQSHSYPNVKAVLAGVEFDVKLDDNMEKCHIITIFDTKNDIDKLNQIDSALKADLLTEMSSYYSKDRFENVLRSIGLDTILIASQRKDIHNHSGNHNSLSDSSHHTEEIIKFGYIDALEFQKPKVEGILINNLKDLEISFPLLSGSDCHDWASYPYHDGCNQNKDFHHSKAKMLPTFKGLLMAVSSPETRFNCRDNTNPSFLSSITLRDKKISFVNGINAIIGENGSGKTTLLELINKKTSAPHVRKLITDNKLSIEKPSDIAKIKYITQGQIIEKFNSRTLFSSKTDNNFLELDNLPFINKYTDFARDLLTSIKNTISKNQVITRLAEHSVTFTPNLEDKTYYINVICTKNFDSISNPHTQRLQDICSLIENVTSMLSHPYYQIYNTGLDTILNELKTIRSDIAKKSSAIEYEIKVKNIIYSCISSYASKTDKNSSSKDQEIIRYKAKRQKVVESVVTAIQESMAQPNWPIEPGIENGVTKNPKRGFNFNREANYNGISVLDDFYSKMFIKKYRDISELQKIDTDDKFQEAVMNCTSPFEIDTRWEENFQKFITGATQKRDYITDGTNQQIGNTLGEMSLSYYKYFAQEDDESIALIIDQPEDNISNNNINHKLITYFQTIRHEKQLIFVTHNPLLVVNLDVDNVIFVENINGLLSISDGCLEFEDIDTNILELIAQNMDGGKETIEKRLRVYGKKY